MKTTLKNDRKASRHRALLNPNRVQPRGMAGLKNRKRRRRALTDAAPRPGLSLSSFDPALPLDGSLIVAEVLRDQFNGLNTLIGQRATPADVDAAMVAAVTSAVAQASSQILPQTSNVSNGVSTMNTSAYSYDEQWQMQLVMDKLDELINALRR